MPVGGRTDNDGAVFLYGIASWAYGFLCGTLPSFWRRWAAIEVKLDVAKADEASANLLRLRDKVAANPLEQNAEPAFLGVVAANAPYFFRRPDGVYVIPVGCLGR